MNEHIITHKIELAIVSQLIDSMLAAGRKITVNDGEDDCLVRSTDKKAILAAMFSTDEDYLFAGKSWVKLVYGNGVDVISDHTVDITELVEPAMAVATALEAGNFDIVPRTFDEKAVVS